MIAFCASAYDLQGQLILYEDVDIIDVGRRGQKKKTLDERVAVYDNGFSWGDISFRVDTELTEDERDIALHFLENYSTLRIAVPDGCFEGQINRITSRHGPTIIYVSLFEKLST